MSRLRLIGAGVLIAAAGIMVLSSCGKKPKTPAAQTAQGGAPPAPAGPAAPTPVAGEADHEDDVPTTAPGTPGPDQDAIERFLLARGYEGAGWSSQPAHLSGATVDGVDYTVHGFVKVYYSPAIGVWLKGPPRKSLPIEDDAMIVALEFDAPARAGGDPGPLRRAFSMVRDGGGQSGGPYDGWFWSTTEFAGAGTSSFTVDSAGSEGSYGAAACFGCHAAAGNDFMVFLDEAGPLDPDPDWKPGGLALPDDVPEPRNDLIKPLPKADPEFLAYFDVDDVPTAVPFPAKSFDHVWAGFYAGSSHAEWESFVTSDQCMGCHNAAELLSNSRPNMWYPDPDPAQNLVGGSSAPNAEAFRNFSPYGEWSASLNALSGRDPVWHAQVDFERKLRPNLADFTTDTCFSCHGPMAQRQVKLDRGPDALFTIDMFYDTHGPDAKYGALARDGVSCAVCHQIASKDLGVDPDFVPWQPPGAPEPTSGFFVPADLKTYTAMFPNPDPTRASGDEYQNAYWGPYAEPQASPMDRAMGLSGEFGAPRSPQEQPQVHESRLCGSCHTVLVPALPVGYDTPITEKNPFDPDTMKMSFEQTTYFEWRNSRYENEKQPLNPTALTCQSCHMSSHREPERIVNTESDRFPPVRGRARDAQITFAERDPVFRHVLLGINYFVFEMYEQFRGLLGTQPIDARVPEKTLDSTLTARDWIEQHAETITADVRVTGLEETGGFLEAEVEVTNLAGHKFPTGAGFRRAFLRFEVLGKDDAVLWASGRFNDLGVLLDGSGAPLASEETTNPRMSQPHHQIITSQDQVQIYETRAMNSEVELQTTVLGIYYEYKDNRILPVGFEPPDEGDSVSRTATAAALVGVVADQPPGVDTQPPDGVSHEATEHPTVLDDGTRPFEVVYDADYWLPAHLAEDGAHSAGRGQDHVKYRVPLGAIEGWTRIRAQLYYQTIPPYYLRDRFETAIDRGSRMVKDRDMNRLIHIASRLNLEGTPAEDWSLRVAAPAEKTRGQAPDPSLSPDEAWARLEPHYTYRPR